MEKKRTNSGLSMELTGKHSIYPHFLMRVLPLIRRRVKGASANDHEARAGRHFEPQSGIHEWPDGSV